MKKTQAELAAEKAVISAAQLVENTAKLADERTIKIIQEYFNEGEKRKRFIDTNRIPFICDDIRDIHKKIDTLSRLIYIGSGVLIAVSALLKWVIK